jgi:hypothetical protein
MEDHQVIIDCTPDEPKATAFDLEDRGGPVALCKQDLARRKFANNAPGFERATTPSGTDDYASEAAATAIVNIHPITAKKTEKMIPISDFLYFMMLDGQAVTVSS